MGTALAPAKGAWAYYVTEKEPKDAISYPGDLKHYWDKIDAWPFGLLNLTLQNKDILRLDYVQQNTVSKYTIKEGH